jgi:hypothetical protein
VSPVGKYEYPLSFKTHLQKWFSFEFCCWKRCRIGIEPFACSATQRTNESCILVLLLDIALLVAESRQALADPCTVLGLI